MKPSSASTNRWTTGRSSSCRRSSAFWTRRLALESGAFRIGRGDQAGEAMARRPWPHVSDQRWSVGAGMVQERGARGTHRRVACPRAEGLRGRIVLAEVAKSLGAVVPPAPRPTWAVQLHRCARVWALRPASQAAGDVPVLPERDTGDHRGQDRARGRPVRVIPSHAYRRLHTASAWTPNHPGSLGRMRRPLRRLSYGRDPEVAGIHRSASCRRYGAGRHVALVEGQQQRKEIYVWNAAGGYGTAFEFARCEPRPSAFKCGLSVGRRALGRRVADQATST